MIYPAGCRADPENQSDVHPVGTPAAVFWQSAATLPVTLLHRETFRNAKSSPLKFNGNTKENKSIKQFSLRGGLDVTSFQ